MSTVNLDTSASSVNELPSATTTTTTSEAASARWRKYLLDELKKERADTTKGTAPLNGMGMPPPPSSADMQALLAKAVAKGVLTQAEADSLASIMAKRHAGHHGHKVKGAGDDMQALFAILKNYMVADDTDESDTTDSTTDATTGTTKTYTVEELQAKMKADKAARLAKLKAAVAAAQAAGVLSTEQLTKINTFITEEETITAGMAKIDAAGLKV